MHRFEAIQQTYLRTPDCSEGCASRLVKRLTIPAAMSASLDSAESPLMFASSHRHYVVFE